MSNSEEKYIGSVRFFKHMILSIVALSVIIPVCACCVLLFFNFRLNKQYQYTEAEVRAYVEELSNVNRQLEESKAELENKTSEIQGLVDSSNTTNSWKLVLVSQASPMQQGFSTELEEVGDGQKVDARIVGELNAMLEAMAAEGLEPVISSAYRTFQEQDKLFDETVSKKVNGGMVYEEAFYESKSLIELPGNSEHQTGLAVDIVSASYETMDEKQADTKEAKWLAEHCEEYGFILRYPEGKESFTGKEAESWHFRYVGKEAASYIMENGMTLEEFVYNLNKDTQS